MYIRAKWRVIGIKWDIYSTSDRATTNISIFQNSTPWHVTSLNIILFSFIHIMTGVPSANCTFLWRAKISWVTPRLAGGGGSFLAMIVYLVHTGPAKRQSFPCGHPANRPFQEVKQHILLFPAHHSLERAFLSPCRTHTLLFAGLHTETYRTSHIYTILFLSFFQLFF